MESALKNELEQIVGERRVACNRPMSQCTSFCIGGPAECVVEPRTTQEAQAVVKACQRWQVPYCVVGLGSDVLVADEGLHGVVIRIAGSMAKLVIEGETLHVQAGCTNEEVARAACAAGLSGYEFASGIPGTIGGAAIMNAGAYGGEFKDVALSLKCLSPEGVLVEITADKADWSYRHSMMDEAGFIVLEATLRLRSDNPRAIQAHMDDLATRRLEKQPLEWPSAGSTFKRPDGYFVGQLVQEAGLRGYCVGGAQVSEKHTGFIINKGGATAADVRQLIVDVQTRVYEHAGVSLVPEVRMWGFDEKEWV